MTLVLRALEHSGIAEFTKDQSGNMIGLMLHLEGHIHAQTHTSAGKLEV